MTVIIAIFLVLGLVGWGCWRGARAYLKFYGKRIVTCPETEQPAVVELATWHLAITAPFQKTELRLSDCSRWRERAPCGQPCLAQIEASPESCLVLTILSKCYEGKVCSCCGASVGQIGRWQHNPCLLSPDLRLFEWKDIPTENIPLALGTHAPVCWRCLVAETHIS